MNPTKGRTHPACMLQTDEALIEIVRLNIEMTSSRQHQSHREDGRFLLDQDDY